MVRSFLLALTLTLCSTYTCTSQSPTPRSQQEASAARAQPQTAPADGTKQKKIWTNEDFRVAHGPASVLGNAKSSSKSASTSSNSADGSYIAKTKKQLDKLQNDISDLDKQIAQLKSFSEGEPVAPSGATKINKSFNRDPVDFQIRELQDKKKQLQDEFDALLDEARKKGVEPGQLR